MIFVRSRATYACLSLAFFFSACVSHTRIITRGNKPGLSKPLLVATKDELIRRLTDRYHAINSFSATVDLTPAVGSVYKGKITQYEDISGYVLYRSSSDIRIIGLLPVVRTKVFDMVSTGTDFRILIPSKDRFLKGRNDAPPSSENSLENLRPEAFLESMLVRPLDLPNETPSLIDATDEHEALYILFLQRVTEDRKVIPLRAIFFDRTNLDILRQKRFRENGDIISDTLYHNFDVFNGIRFPKTIEINRPKDGYGVVINVRSMEMNKELADDRFVLEQPEGTQLQVIGTPANGSPK